MKKALSVMILLAFFGSTIIMTGCLGGSDGIGAVLATGFVIAIVASSGGSAAPTVFAANQRSALRPAISETTDKNEVKIIVIPLKDGIEQGQGTEYSEEKIIWEADPNDSTRKRLKVDATVYTTTSDEYRIKVLYNDNIVIEGVRHIGSSDISGSTTNIDPESTAKSLIYENWKTKAAQDTYKAFEYNFDNKDISEVVKKINASLASDTKNPDYSTNDVKSVIETTADEINTKGLYSVSGYIKDINGRGLNNANVYINAQGFNESTTTSNGYYTFNDIPDGSYTVSASYFVEETHDHKLFTPDQKLINVDQENVTDVNFDEYEETFTGSIK